MIEPRLAWFAAGAACSAMLFGWPWHARFSRYTRMQDPDWRRSFSHENTNCPSGPPPLKLRRDISSISYPDPGPDRQPTNPFTGEPVKPQFPSPRVIPGDMP